MTGSETLPLSIAINFSNPAGSAGQADFWVGNNAVAPTTFETAAASTVLSSQTNNGNVSTTGYTFTQYLYDGSTGSQVTALQERLTTDGIYSGPITGTFGPLTKAAVKAYQAKHGLDQLGVVGPATRALLNRGI
jgi:peptidoglycan hydrolase-like protein with peptidoglycan-binding domain